MAMNSRVTESDGSHHDLPMDVVDRYYAAVPATDSEAVTETLEADAEGGR